MRTRTPIERPGGREHPVAQTQSLPSTSSIEAKAQAPGRGCLLLSPPLLGRVDANATENGKCPTSRSRLKRHEDVIRHGIGGHAVRIGSRGHVLKPGVRQGINDSEYRPPRHTSPSHGIALACWI